MTHSLDLRKRVVAFVREGGSKSEVARRFKVSRWCVYQVAGTEHELVLRPLAPGNGGPKR